MTAMATSKERVYTLDMAMPPEDPYKQVCAFNTHMS